MTWIKPRGRIWGGGDIGVASLERSYSVTGSTQNTEFAMTFRGGYAWHPRRYRALTFRLGFIYR
jgi:hypothetical protein